MMDGATRERLIAGEPLKAPASSLTDLIHGKGFHITSLDEAMQDEPP